MSGSSNDQGASLPVLQPPPDHSPTTPTSINSEPVTGSSTDVSTSEAANPRLDINDHGEVYIACKPVSSKRRDIAARLGVLENTLATIEADYSRVERCLSAVIDKWLRRPVGEVADDGVLPSWRNLCVALSPIDRVLAEGIAVEHGCTIISPTVSKITKDSDVPPAFLSYSCGCGRCAVRGWMTCQIMCLYAVTQPKLYIVEPQFVQFGPFESHHTRQLRLCQETKYLIDMFDSLSSATWNSFHHSLGSNIHATEVTRELASKLRIPLLDLSDFRKIQDFFHSHNVNWFSFGLLYFLYNTFLREHCPDITAEWDTYLSLFKEYCSTRNIKDFIGIFFEVEDNNIFLIEIDECYYDFTLSDVDSLRKSLSIALDVPAVSLHLVTVQKKCLLIYFYYCYSDYLTRFMSLSSQQLKMIAHIRPHKILSLTDLYNQFEYDKIQSYYNYELLKKQAVFKLSKKEAENRLLQDQLEKNKDQLELERKDHLKAKTEMMGLKDTISKKEDGSLKLNMSDSNNDESKSDVSETEECLQQSLQPTDIQYQTEEELARNDQKIMSSPLQDESVEGILAIKPDWDKHTIGDTSTSGIESELGDIQDDLTLKEAIITYHNMKVKLLKESDNLKKELELEKEMRKKATMELDQMIESQEMTRLKKVLEERDKEIMRMREEIKALQQEIKLKPPTLRRDGQDDLDSDLFTAAENGDTLHTASHAGCTEIVEKLLSNGASIEAKNNQNGCTPLHSASHAGYTEVVKKLLSKGAPIEAQNDHGNTPLHTASNLGHTEVVQILLSNGASIEAKNKHGNTPLHRASNRGYTEVVQILLSNGASKEAKDEYGNTPLHTASYAGHTNVVEKLLSNGAQIEAKNTDGCTPLHSASHAGRTKVVKKLLSNGAPIEAKNNNGTTPLHAASNHSHTEVVQVLLSNGAPLEAKNNYGCTPLNTASNRGRTEVVQILLSNGASIESKDNYGNTPLHSASNAGYTEVVENLLSKGASIESKTNDLQSPLHVSIGKGHTDIAMWLIQARANVYAEDKYGQSPILMATVMRNEEVIKCLMSNGVEKETIDKYLLPSDWTASLDNAGQIVYTNKITSNELNSHPNFTPNILPQ